MCIALIVCFRFLTAVFVGEFAGYLSCFNTMSILVLTAGNWTSRPFTWTRDSYVWPQSDFHVKLVLGQKYYFESRSCLPLRTGNRAGETFARLLLATWTRGGRNVLGSATATTSGKFDALILLALEASSASDRAGFETVLFPDEFALSWRPRWWGSWCRPWRIAISVTRYEVKSYAYLFFVQYWMFTKMDSFFARSQANTS